MKLRILLVCILAFCLAGCVPVSEQTKANIQCSIYEVEYRDAVYDLFGKDAILDNIKGEIRSQVSTAWSGVTYVSSGKLKGELVLDGIKYQSYYDPETMQEMSMVHEKDVLDSFCSRMPFDKSKIILMRVMPDTDGYAAFVDVVDNPDYFETALLSTTMYFGINTTEDLRSFTDEQLLENIEIYAHTPWLENHTFNVSVINTDTSDAIAISIESGSWKISRNWEEDSNVSI